MVKRLGRGGQGNSCGRSGKWSCCPLRSWDPGVGEAWVTHWPMLRAALGDLDRKITRLILTACRGATWELGSPDRHTPALGVMGGISIQKKDRI